MSSIPLIEDDPFAAQRLYGRAADIERELDNIEAFFTGNFSKDEMGSTERLYDDLWQEAWEQKKHHSLRQKEVGVYSRWQ